MKANVVSRHLVHAR